MDRDIDDKARWVHCHPTWMPDPDYLFGTCSRLAMLHTCDLKHWHRAQINWNKCAAVCTTESSIYVIACHEYDASTTWNLYVCNCNVNVTFWLDGWISTFEFYYIILVVMIDNVSLTKWSSGNVENTIFPAFSIVAIIFTMSA
jgi:hypothetical protein